MNSWKGNTSSSASMTVYNTAVQIPYLIFVNSSEGTATLNVYIMSGSTTYRISPKDFTLTAGQAYEVAAPYFLKEGEILYFTTDQTTYYYATISTDLT